MITLDISGWSRRSVEQLDGFQSTTVSESAWHAARQAGIGGSDAAAALGLSPWKTRLELWHEKTQGRKPLDDSMRLRFGHHAEAFVLGEYLRERPTFTAVSWPQHVVAVSEDYSWMRCTPDAIAHDPDHGAGIVQIKTASAFRRDDWEEGPPAHYLVQCLHEMYVTRANWCDLVVMFGAGERLEIMRIERNETELIGLVQLETRFWGDVQAGTCPDLSPEEALEGGADLGRRLGSLYAVVPGMEVELPPYEAQVAHDRIVELQAAVMAMDDEIDQQKNLLRSWIGDAEFGRLPDGSGYSWREQERRGYVVAPTVLRVLQFRKGKR